jgi:hypothetical protein
LWQLQTFQHEKIIPLNCSRRGEGTGIGRLVAFIVFDSKTLTLNELWTRIACGALTIQRKDKKKPQMRG